MFESRQSTRQAEAGWRTSRSETEQSRQYYAIEKSEDLDKVQYLQSGGK